MIATKQEWEVRCDHKVSMRDKTVAYQGCDGGNFYVEINIQLHIQKGINFIVY